MTAAVRIFSMRLKKLSLFKLLVHVYLVPLGLRECLQGDSGARSVPQ